MENENMKNVFPLKQGENKNVRNREKYEVFHANTERYKTSPIPYLQRLLNQMEAEKKKRNPGQ
jgi:hypothetical protein